MLTSFCIKKKTFLGKTAYVVLRSFTVAEINVLYLLALGFFYLMRVKT